MRSSIERVVLRAALWGLGAVLISVLPLFLVHRALGLGPPPVTGLLLLGSAVVLAFALSAVVGFYVGKAGGNSGISALLSAALAIVTCVVVAPLYAGFVVEGLTRDATGLVWAERERIETSAREVAKGRAAETWTAAREGRLREQLAEYQKQAQQASTSQGRAIALEQMSKVGTQLATLGQVKAVSLLKSGAARTSSFVLLLWALVGCPLVGALSCRSAK